MKDYYVVKLEGLNISNVLSACSVKNVDVFDIVKTAKCSIKISILIKNYAFLIKICEMYNVSYKAVGEKSMSSCMTKLVKRIGVLIGLILSFFMIWSLSGIVWNINCVVDNDESGLQRQTVIEFLKLKGVDVGMKTNDVDCSLLEREISSGFENFSQVVVKREGVNILIRLKENLKMKENSTQNIIATTDGVVVKLDVFAGVAKVKVGDTVKVGDLLVVSQFDGGVCLANVYVKTWVQCEKVEFIAQNVMVRTGKESINNSLYFFAKKVSSENKKCNFEFYEKEESRDYLCDNLFVPLFVISEKFYELKQDVVVRDVGDLEVEMKEKIVAELEEKYRAMFPTANLENVYHSVNVVDGFIKIVSSAEIIVLMS